MEEKTKILRAADARAMSEMSNFLKNNVYKNIKYCANENRTKMMWDLEDCSAAAVKDLIDDLQSNGYTVDIVDDRNMLVVTW